MKILHVITDLNGIGGAEAVLYRLLERMDGRRFRSEVVVLKSKGADGTIGEAIERLGVPVHELGVRGRRFGLGSLVRLARIVRRAHADVVQTWLYHPNLLGGIIARLMGVRAVVWSIRSGAPLRNGSKATTYWTFRAGRLLSGIVPEKIVCCAAAALNEHAAAGYRAGRMVLIRNGFDTARYVPGACCWSSVRGELGIADSALIIGLVARFHPVKGHKSFVDAAACLARSAVDVMVREDVHFVLCGERVTRDNAQLVSWIRDAGLEERFHLLGRRTDVPRLTAAFDIATLSSVTEAFPNVVGEAMACAVPCVATDVGDASAMLGDCGRVVPPAHAQAMAAAWLDLIRMGRDGRARLGEAARRRVVVEYGIGSMIEAYERLYEGLARAGHD